MAVPVTLTEYAPDVPTVIDVVPGMLKEEYLNQPTGYQWECRRLCWCREERQRHHCPGEVVGAQRQADGENSIERDIERGAAAARLRRRGGTHRGRQHARKRRTPSPNLRSACHPQSAARQQRASRPHGLQPASFHVLLKHFFAACEFLRLLNAAPRLVQGMHPPDRALVPEHS
jgi:hypothetical protein